MKLSNRIILVIAFIFSAYSLAGGRDFKVLYLSSSDAVYQNGRPLLIGDIFTDKANLFWKDENQVIKVSDTQSHIQYIICAKRVPGKKNFTLSDYFLLTKPLASRSGDYSTLNELSTFFNGDIIIDNHLVIPTSILQDENHFFYLSCQFQNGVVNKAISPSKGALILCTASIFKVDGIKVPPLTTRASLYYYNAIEETSICVSRDFTIIPVCE